MQWSADNTPMEKHSFVYILASGRYGTLYIGVTSDLIRRVWQHNEGFVEGFTKTHHVHQLVWYEIHTDIIAAITREKQIKKWRRNWKINLIQSTNPAWHDLYPTIAA
ncbi:GIY-YIG nuclease family protein [Massilia varians]|uniref:GIY-YIG nuclease family protein n=1 Tax=Massilia varians TaxID=457921 RepID=UPI0025521DE5|nr:GIY-YIG nuclease family protein [Massilia varians]MDK6077082.1 GIY-YIG nuclease family protein [Massilia varians]